MTNNQNALISLKVVIINYFCAEQTQQLISVLLNLTLPGVNMSIICADNSNDQKEAKALIDFQRSQVETVDLIFNEQNLGFGNAINEAVGLLKDDYLLLLNPDVVIKENTIITLIHSSQTNPRAGIWGGTTILDNGHGDNRHAWREPTLLRALAWATGLSKLSSKEYLVNHYESQAKTQKQPYPVDSISGCCMLIDKTVWLKNSGFDSRFFLYSEEIDFCRRARIAGFQPTVAPDCKLFHAVSHTDENTSRMLMLHRAKFIYAKKHHGAIHVFAFRVIIGLGALIRSCVSLSRNRNGARSWWEIFKLSTQKNIASASNDFLKNK